MRPNPVRVRARPAALVALLLLAGCALRSQAPVVHVPADAIEVLVPVGEVREAYDGAVRVHLISMERGPKEAAVVLRLESGGQVQQQEVGITRSEAWSDPVRLEGWGARLSGYPGVDAARIIVWRD